MSRERPRPENILALARSRDEQARAVETAATSYMPTNIDLEAWLPDESGLDPKQGSSSAAADGGRRDRSEKPDLTQPGGATRGFAKKKRISLYLDDDVLTKIFKVSLERHEQLSSATHRLILEALKAWGI
jgi:hypothetical protein